MNGLTLRHGGDMAAMTMSSLEISRLVESNHADVRRSIERLANRGVITLPPLAEVSNDGPGPKTISVYGLCKRDSLIVVAQLCPEFTARIVDRWQELEEWAAKHTPNPANLSRLQLIELAMQAETERLALECKVKEMAPKVEALDRIADSEGGCCLTLAAKTLQQKPREFIARLMGWHWIYRHPGGRLTAYQEVINRGYLEHKVGTVETRDGNDKSVWNVVVTPKGLARMAMKLGVSLEGDMFDNRMAA